MNEKTKNVLLGLSAALLVAACASWIGVKVETYNWNARQEKSAKQATDAQKRYDAKYRKLKQQVMTDGASSANQTIKSVSLQNGSMSLMNSVDQKLFTTLYTYDNAKQYLARANKLSGMITDDVKNDKKLFGDKTTGEMITATGLSSNAKSVKTTIESADEHNITALARVTFESGYSGASSHTGIYLYEVGYSKDQHKVTSITQVQAGLGND